MPVLQQKRVDEKISIITETFIEYDVTEENTVHSYRVNGLLLKRNRFRGHLIECFDGYSHRYNPEEHPSAIYSSRIIFRICVPILVWFKYAVVRQSC